jgi:hypothetical protein
MPRSYRTGVGDALLWPVEDHRGHAGADVVGAPGAAGGPVAAADDVRMLRPPPVGIVELATGQLVAEGEDLRRPRRRPPHHDRAHALIVSARTMRA